MHLKGTVIAVYSLCKKCEDEFLNYDFIKNLPKVVHETEQ
jgi:hypothetical protein